MAGIIQSLLSKKLHLECLYSGNYGNLGEFAFIHNGKPYYIGDVVNVERQYSEFQRKRGRGVIAKHEGEVFVFGYRDTDMKLLTLELRNRYDELKEGDILLSNLEVKRGHKDG